MYINDLFLMQMFEYFIVKFMFSKKATKIDEIFTNNLTLCSTVSVK